MTHITSASALRSELCVGNTTLSSGTQVTVPCVSDGLWTALNTTVGVLKNGGSGGDFVPIPAPPGTGLLQINEDNSTTVATTTPGSKLVMSGDGGFKDAQYLSLMKEPLTDATGGRLVQHHSNEIGENRSHFVGGPGVVLTGADKKVSLLATTTHATGKYLDDTGAWSAPPGGGVPGSGVVYTDNGVESALIGRPAEFSGGLSLVQVSRQGAVSAMAFSGTGTYLSGGGYFETVNTTSQVGGLSANGSLLTVASGVRDISKIDFATLANGTFLDNTGAFTAPAGSAHAPILSTMSMASALGIDAAGQYTVTVSSRRFKNKIEQLDVRKSAGKLDRLRVVGFEYVAHPGHRQVGLIAEEVDDVFPEYVNRQQGEIYNVNYAAFVPELIAGYQALREEVNMLKRQRE